MPNWCWNSVQTASREDAEAVRDFIEPRLDRPQVQGISEGDDGKWYFQFESRWNIPEDEYEELIRERPDVELYIDFDEEESRVVGSIYAPGDGTAWMACAYEPDFGGDDAARTAWLESDELNARVSDKRERFV